MDWKTIKLWFLSRKCLTEQIACLEEHVAFLQDTNDSLNRELQAARLNLALTPKKKVAKKKKSK